MQDKIRMNELLDFYSDLLTDNQRDICKMYYRYDLSLSEIAIEENISRSAVYDTVNRCQKELERYESILRLADKAEKRREYFNLIKEKTDDKDIIELLNKSEHLEF